MSSKDKEEEEFQQIEGKKLQNITTKNIGELNYSEKDVHHLDNSKDK